MKRLSLTKIETNCGISVMLVKAIYTYGILTLFLPVVSLLSSCAAAAYVFGKMIRRASPQRRQSARSLRHCFWFFLPLRFLFALTVNAL
jgi:hypothetical protein